MIVSAFYCLPSQRCLLITIATTLTIVGGGMFSYGMIAYPFGTAFAQEKGAFIYPGMIALMAAMIIWLILITKLLRKLANQRQ